ncbi:sugar-binding domain-containing protein [Mucilaginibacter sp. OK098]|uniref:sugar-binding domain-containing protein n=1 Tax=Mucilaginibacter sp. OK098 TaxID=1855297 RepID=UPI00091E3C7C|nr:sugar-binding domain-containing protein [Mucilaginibacter sp. OK098]SHN11931.1 Glycosyl hydrolases family 2 [Mucilaginibacter sp. OK098]
MKKIIYFILSGLLTCCSIAGSGQVIQNRRIDLSGNWSFGIDSLDTGVKDKWFNNKLPETIHLPGSMTTNGKGDDITLHTPWTGGVWNAQWYKDSSYAKYRQPDNIKVSFWLQPVKHYVGAAWYQKEVVIPREWSGQHIELFLERCHWETTLWIDGKEAGMQNALSAPHLYELDNLLKPGKHVFSIRIDNRIKDIDPGADAHSVSDNTQTNWNGIIGEMTLNARPAVYLSSVQLFPDVDKKLVVVKVKIKSLNTNTGLLKLALSAEGNKGNVNLPTLHKTVTAGKDSTIVSFTYPMGTRPLLWDEFNPNLYHMKVTLVGKKGTDSQNVTFGMRKFIAKGRQFTINNRPIFLRGTLECAIFPKTGFPPVDKAAWARIFRISRSYGLNHMRFHSWCPPEAAFEAADEAGFYLSIECSAWATVGDGKPIDKFIYAESNRIVNAFGNHPSFCMMPYGNEPGGDHHLEFLTGFVKYWKQKDPRRLYTTASGWPIIPENDYNSTPDPRIQAWGAGVKSIINAEPPSTNYDWSSIINKWPQPTVSHEIGQWCVYPNFKEIKKYDGVLKPKNFEIFYDRLKEHDLTSLADSFLIASGKLQVLCYKADIEAALRTKGFGGFQLLDLHDFPGQGTALVGVLDPFWDDKGYVTAKEYSRFCNATVPLARMTKLIYQNNEKLEAAVEIAHYGSTPLKHITPTWQLQDGKGKILYKGQLKTTDIPIGNGFKLGQISQSLTAINRPAKLSLQINAGGHINSWDIFVYPSHNPEAGKNIYVTQQLDEKALAILNSGGKVLLTIKKGAIKDAKGGSVAVGFSSIFWNTSWTNNQPPHTLGILCNPKHPALAEFPTDYYSNWEWQDAMSHSNAIRLDSLSSDIKPIVRIIDDWFTARPLGLIFECKAGNGSLMVSGIDLLTNQEKRPEAKQLLYSLEAYMNTPAFKPAIPVKTEKLAAIFK